MTQPTEHVEQVDPRLIELPKQVRTEFNPEALQELQDTIEQVGILQPVLLRKEGDRLIALDGERRIRAAINLNLPTIPALIGDRSLNNGEVIKLQLISNCMREGLSITEQSKAIQQMMIELNLTALEAAKRIGKSKSTVSKLIALKDATPEIQAKIDSGELGLRAAYGMIRQVYDQSANESKHRFQQLTAKLGKKRKMVFHGFDSTYEALREAVTAFLRHLRRSERQGVGLPRCLAGPKEKSAAT